MKVQLEQGNAGIATVTGIFEYDDNSLYTAGDFVIYLGPPGSRPNDPIQYGIYLCIKDVPTVPAKQYLTDEEYFKPYWYYNSITDLSEYIYALRTTSTEKVMLQKTLASILQRKFGTGILVAAANKNDGKLNLDLIDMTGRYILLIEDYNSVDSFPPFMLTFITQNNTDYVSKVYGLDVFSYGLPNGPKLALQVIYAGFNNKVILALRKKEASNQWTDWVAVRSTPDITAINAYLESHSNIFNEFFNGARKQSFGMRLQYDDSKIDQSTSTMRILDINMHSIRSSILRELHSLLIVYKADAPPNTYYNGIIPVPNGTQTSFKVSMNGELFDAEIFTGQNNIEVFRIKIPKKYRVQEVVGLS